VDRITVLPRNEAGARTIAVVVNGKRFALGPSWTKLDLRLKHVAQLRLRVIAAKTGSASAGGLAEVRIPGLRITESLRPPLLAERALAGTNLNKTTLQYAFTRGSGDNPWKRSDSAGAVVTPRVTDPSELEQLRVDGAGDEEVGIDRVISPPARREYDVKAWLSVTPEAQDSEIDRLVGATGPLVADSSGRFQGKPGNRASSAFDGDPRTAWIAPYPETSPRGAWLSVSTRQPIALSQLGLVRATAKVAYPTRVEVIWPGGRSGPLPVTGGQVVLPQPVVTRAFELHVLAASPADTGAVGIGELRAPGLPAMHPRRSGHIRGCGQVAVLGGDRVATLRVDGDIRALDAGRPLAASGCRRLPLGAGRHRIEIPAATLRPDSVLLTSPAPSPVARTSAIAGAVTDPGDPGRGSRDNVKLGVSAPAWLVLGESFDRGWRAWCNGHSLGKPVPLDGYANAWPVEPGCTNARFAFAPQKPVHIIQILSVLACLALLAIALAGWRRRAALDPPAADDWPDPAPTRMPAPRAALWGLIAGGVLAFCFSLRSGVLIAPGIALVLWLGIPAMPLAALGGVLLAVGVSLDYVLFPAPDFGGYNPGYAGDQVSGHWIAVAAWVLLALALWRTLSTASARRRAPAGAPADAAE
jgi:hypothetical protein